MSDFEDFYKRQIESIRYQPIRLQDFSEIVVDVLCEDEELCIRPFIPSMLDEEKEGREEFARLTYKGMTVEIDFTILGNLVLNCESDLMLQTVAIFNQSLKRMGAKMRFNGSEYAK